MEIITLKEAKEKYPDGKTTSELAETSELSLQGLYAAACRLKLKEGADYIMVSVTDSSFCKFYFGKSVQRIINRSTKKTGRPKNPNVVRKVRGKVGRPKKVIEYVVVKQDCDLVVRCDSNVKFQLVQNGNVINEGNYSEMSKLFYSWEIP